MKSRSSLDDTPNPSNISYVVIVREYLPLYAPDGTKTGTHSLR